MLGDAAGVRDEVGFLLIHQRYADRFFPGTSVLHTRLRYALFVPWLLERLRDRGLSGRAFAAALVREETALAERLKGESYGVIGRLMLPGASNQPPSYVYWTALSTWGLIARKSNGRSWSRSDVAALDRGGRSVRASSVGSDLPSPRTIDLKWTLFLGPGAKVEIDRSVR